MIALRECSCGATAYTHEDLELFHKQSECKYGRSNTCKKCITQRSSKHYKANKSSYIKRCSDNRRIRRRELLDMKGGKCSCCGVTYTDDTVAEFHFHHLDPSQKSFSIGQRNTLSAAVLEELEKCVLLCASCHRLEHKK